MIATTAIKKVNNDRRKSKQNYEHNNIQEGDILGVRRSGYDHYGVYIGNSRVIHYTSMSSDIDMKNNRIMETDIKHFLREERNIFVLNCENPALSPRFPAVAIPTINPTSFTVFGVQQIMSQLVKAFRNKEKKIYTPEETVQRAKSKLGEQKYNLVTNNCEHFAIWCKTGISQSHQVDAYLDLIASKYVVSYPRFM